MNNKKALSLSESSNLRYFTFIGLYFSQGIPEGITIFAIPAWMAMHGKSAVEIASYSAIIIIPFSLKILLAPIMERYTYLPMGRRRPWLLFGQLGIIMSLVSLALVSDPLNNISGITLAALCLHVFIMFQDIATDSLVIDIVPIEQQGKANSLMWGSKTIGTSAALFIGSYLINAIGFSNAILSMSVSIFLIMFIPLMLTERSGEKKFPWSAGATSPDSALLAIDSWSKIFRSFMRVIMLPNTILLVATVFITMGATHYLTTLLPVFTIQELGWSNISYSRIFAASNLAGGIIGMIAGGLVIQRYGIIRLIQGTLLMAVVLAVAISALIPFWKVSGVISGFIAVFCLFRTLIYIGVLALAMRLCWKRISAIQFTFCMTVVNAGLASGAALVGPLREVFEWQILFVAFAILVVISMAIFRFIKISRHREQVDLLETKFLDILHAEGTLLVKSETN